MGAFEQTLTQEIWIGRPKRDSNVRVRAVLMELHWCGISCQKLYIYKKAWKIKEQ